MNLPIGVAEDSTVEAFEVPADQELEWEYFDVQELRNNLVYGFYQDGIKPSAGQPSIHVRSASDAPCSTAPSLLGWHEKLDKKRKFLDTDSTVIHSMAVNGQHARLEEKRVCFIKGAAKNDADCPRDTLLRSGPAVRLTKIMDLASRDLNLHVNLMCVVQDISTKRQVATSYGTVRQLLSLIVADASQAFFKVNAWGAFVNNIDQMGVLAGDVVFFKGLRLSKYNGHVHANTSAASEILVLWRDNNKPLSGRKQAPISPSLTKELIDAKPEGTTATKASNAHHIEITNLPSCLRTHLVELHRLIAWTQQNGRIIHRRHTLDNQHNLKNGPLQRPINAINYMSIAELEDWAFAHVRAKIVLVSPCRVLKTRQDKRDRHSAFIVIADAPGSRIVLQLWDNHASPAVIDRLSAHLGGVVDCRFVIARYSLVRHAMTLNTTRASSITTIDPSDIRALPVLHKLHQGLSRSQVTAVPATMPCPVPADIERQNHTCVKELLSTQMSGLFRLKMRVKYIKIPFLRPGQRLDDNHATYLLRLACPKHVESYPGNNLGKDNNLAFETCIQIQIATEVEQSLRSWQAINTGSEGRVHRNAEETKSYSSLLKGSPLLRCQYCGQASTAAFIPPDDHEWRYAHISLLCEDEAGESLVLACVDDESIASLFFGIPPMALAINIIEKCYQSRVFRATPDHETLSRPTVESIPGANNMLEEHNECEMHQSALIIPQALVAHCYEHSVDSTFQLCLNAQLLQALASLDVLHEVLKLVNCMNGSVLCSSNRTAEINSKIASNQKATEYFRMDVYAQQETDENGLLLMNGRQFILRNLQ